MKKTTFLMELALLIILMPIVIIFAVIYFLIEKIDNYKTAREVRKFYKKGKK